MNQDSRGSLGTHFLLVGDSTDLGTIKETVGRLPVDAYGQIYIEVSAESEIEHWSVPGGMMLTWLRRDRASSDVSSMAARGELVTRVVSAWVAEWMPEWQSVHGQPYVLWIGCSASKQVDRLYRELSVRIGPTHLRHPHSD